MYEINLANRLAHARVHVVTALANLLTDHGMSGLPIRAKYPACRPELSPLLINYF